MLAPILLLALAAAPGAAPAPAASASPEARFDAMAERHLLEFRGLLRTRGEPPAVHGRLPLAGLRAVLGGAFGPETAVLVYSHRADEAVLDAWLVAADGVRASASTPLEAAALDDAVAGLRAALGGDALVAARAPRPRGLKRPAPPAGPAPASAAALARLRALLLPPPIAAALAPVRELLVAPTLELGAVPFAALELDGRALIEDRTITVLPNLFGLGAVGAAGAAGTGPLRPALVVGDPDLSVDPAWDFPPLPGARAEARQVGAVTGSPPLLGRQATRAAVQARLRGAELLYLATHGVALPEDPLGGFLALSGPAGVDRWTAREIQGERLQARLAVLSACQTGLGRGHAGGVIGVARAFQLAGVPSVVMSLWSVDDDATALLMRSFLELAAGAPPAQALRQAMLRARQRYPDPLRWAAFALFATPPGRPGAGVGQGGARLALVDEDGRIAEDGGRAPVGRTLALRVLGDAGPARRHRYLVELDPAGALQLVEAPEALAFTPPLGRETLLLLEADRPRLGGDDGEQEPRAAGASVEWAGVDGDLPRTLAGLAAMFPLEDPGLRLRILQLHVETVAAGAAPGAPPARP